MLDWYGRIIDPGVDIAGGDFGLFMWFSLETNLTCCRMHHPNVSYCP